MLNNSYLSILTVFALSLSISGCSTWLGEDEGPGLPGERISILTLEESLEPDDVALSAEGFIVSEPWDNQFWPQAGGYPNHAMQHLSLTPDQPERLWSTSIGRGSRSDNPLLTQPIVVDGIIYAMSTDKRVIALDAQSGERIWQRDLIEDNDETLQGGGLAFGGSYIYATTGGTAVTALGPKTGEVFWTAQLNSPLRAAPTAFEDHVYVTTLDNRVLALDSETGATIWSHQGLQETAGFLGAPSPAANGKIVVPAFSSGEVFALRRENGSVAWADSLASLRSRGGAGGLNDIVGHPVLDKGFVFAQSYGGQIVAIDERSGNSVWDRNIGGQSTPWVAGNHIFTLTKDNELLALGRDSGAIRWVTQLRRFKDQDDAYGPVGWVGPVLAGGRLLLISTLGEVVALNPEDGSILREWKASGPVRISPVIAKQTLYVLDDQGRLTAYR